MKFGANKNNLNQDDKIGWIFIIGGLIAALSAIPLLALSWNEIDGSGLSQMGIVFLLGGGGTTIIGGIIVIVDHLF